MTVFLSNRFHKFSQQIEETQAKTLCQEFKEKKNEKESAESDCKNLPRSVANAARGLCREMLRYKGKMQSASFSLQPLQLLHSMKHVCTDIFVFSEHKTNKNYPMVNVITS